MARKQDHEAFHAVHGHLELTKVFAVAEGTHNQLHAARLHRNELESAQRIRARLQGRTRDEDFRTGERSLRRGYLYHATDTRLLRRGG